jgi:general secretion pathway protein D
VLVEALIVEISENRMLNLGVDWQTRPFDTVNPPGTTMPPGTGLTNGPIPGTNMGNTFATLGTNFGMGFIRAGDIQVVIEALQQDSNTHVLSTPSLVVLDNQEAAISVGQTVAFPTGSFTTNGDNINPFTTFNREDVALSLAVIPQINDDGSVSLQIFHENETIDPTSAGLVFNGQTTSIPTTNKSEIQTSVIVENGDVLVLGGLISNQRQGTRRSTPFLGSIPIIGLAFQSRLNNEDRRNLMVFLRPRIITTPEEGIRITDRKYQYIRNKQIVIERPLNTDFIPDPWDIDIRIPEPFTPRARARS